MAKLGRPGANKAKKGPTKGTGGHGRKALEGKGPTPKAEDRAYHNTYRTQKARAEAKNAPKKGQFVASKTGKSSKANATEILSGRNSVLEALKAKIPATALFIAQRIEVDDRVRDAMAIANNRGIPINEITRIEVDRMTGADSVHQGIAVLTVFTRGLPCRCHRIAIKIQTNCWIARCHRARCHCWSPLMA